MLSRDELRELFIYDESVPSCLRWRVSPSKSHPYLKNKMAGSIGRFGRYNVKLPKYKPVTSPRIVYQMHFGDLKETDYIFLKDQNKGSILSNIIKLDLNFVTKSVNIRPELKFWDLFYYDSGKLFWKIYNFSGSLNNVLRLTCCPNDEVHKVLRSDSYVSTGHSYIKGGTKFYHRIVWMVYYQKELLDNEEIDHIDGDRTNNNIENLRKVNRSANARNTKFNKLNTSGVKGVYFCKNRTSSGWRGRITINGKSVSKYFNINIFGKDRAFNMAVEWRKNKILELNKIYGENGYTDRHEEVL